MALYVTTSGTWGVDYRDEYGRRHRKPVGSKEAALHVLANLRESTHTTRAALSNFQAGESLSVEAARDIYLAHLPVTDRTRWNQQQRIDQFARRAGASRITDATPQLLETFIEERRQEVAPTTLAFEAGVLKRWFRWLAQEHYIMSSPAQALDDRQPRGKPAHVLSYTEEAAVLRELRGWTATKFLIAIDAGLRISEVNALRRNHIDLQQATLTVHARPGTKTRASRTLPLTARLAAALTAHAAHLAPDSLLFTFGGAPIRKGTDFLKKLWPRVGFHFRFHDLRHTFATRLAAHTPNPHAVREALGHALTTLIDPTLPAVTGRYVHPPLEEIRAAIQQMDAANQKGETP